MKITKINCTACGAPISIPEDLDFINCASCGTFLGIERGEGYVALKVAEKLAKAIETSGKDTQSVIRENTLVTRAELQRLQLQHDLSTTQMQLANIQSEIRGLQRMPANATTQNQMKNLWMLEYQAMDRIRVLQAQIAAPDTNDVQAQIRCINQEIDAIDNEVKVLNQLPIGQTSSSLENLKQRRNELTKQLTELKAGEIRKQLKAYKIKHIVEDDPEQLDHIMGLLAEDQKVLQGMPNSPEVRVVSGEVAERVRAVRQARMVIEQGRVKALLHSNDWSYDATDLPSAREQLRRIDEDLQTLATQPGNEVVISFRNTLTGEQKRVQKLIQKFEKDQAKAAKRALDASKPKKAFFLTGLLMSLAAFFVAVGASTRRALERVQAAPQPQPSAVATEAAADSSTSSITRSLDEVDGTTPTRGSEPVKSQPINWETAKSWGKGIFIGLALWIAFFIFGLMLGMILFPNLNDQNRGFPIAIMFLLGAVGCGIGAWYFLTQVAPNTCIRGAFGLPDIHISKVKTRKGLQNKWVLKAITGLIALGISFNFFILVIEMTYIPGKTGNPAPGLLAILIGLILVIFVVARTSVSDSIDATNE